MNIWPQNPDELTKQIRDELEKMLVLGYVRIVGVNKQGHDLYEITEEGVVYYDKLREWVVELFPDADDLI
jgi:DNA-binding PadR family transcriptional regulator